MKRFVSLFLISILLVVSNSHELISGENKNSHLSTNAQKVKVLYEELQRFKNDPKFHEVGYGRCCKYYQWSERVTRLRDNTPQEETLELLGELGFLPFDLWMLGSNYIKTKGGSNSYISTMEATILAGFKPFPKIKKGRGLVITTDRACTKLSSFKGMYKALEAGDYGKADAFLSEADCPRIYEKTIVMGPLGKKITPYGTYYKVKLPHGEKVWMGSGQLEFK